LLNKLKLSDRLIPLDNNEVNLRKTNYKETSSIINKMIDISKSFLDKALMEGKLKNER